MKTHQFDEKQVVAAGRAIRQFVEMKLNGGDAQVALACMAVYCAHQFGWSEGDFNQAMTHLKNNARTVIKDRDKRLLAGILDVMNREAHDKRIIVPGVGVGAKVTLN